MAPPLLLDQIAPTRQWVRGAQREGQTVGLVPTMGALHEGHLSLARAARERGDRVIASIFVNPTQFAPGEDYERYPRDLQADAARLAEVGVEAVFAPSVETMYPSGSGTTIDVGSVATPFEGASRPIHFSGVATVVAKLFHIAPADRAYFGQKDYQQTVVVRRMVTDLNLPIEIVVCPIIREPDGLAMSSRNAYLTDDERQRALALNRGLRIAESLHAAGERDATRLREAARCEIESTPGVELEYVALMAEGTVEEVTHVEGPAVIAVAARVDQTRLIDNVRLH